MKILKTVAVGAAVAVLATGTVFACKNTLNNDVVVETGYHKVTICHYTDSGFVKLNVSKNALKGHEQHENDIIPNVQNWDVLGQATYNNDCVVPVPKEETPPPAPTPPPTPAPVPTPAPAPDTTTLDSTPPLVNTFQGK